MSDDQTNRNYQQNRNKKGRPSTTFNQAPTIETTPIQPELDRRNEGSRTPLHGRSQDRRQHSKEPAYSLTPGRTPQSGQFLDSYAANRQHTYRSSYNTTQTPSFNASSMATTVGSSPLFSPFSDESEYLGSPKRLNYMYNTRNIFSQDEYLNTVSNMLWLICIGVSLTFLIFTLVVCFLLLYESKHKIPMN